MKTFTATNNDGLDILHILGNKDLYTVTESNGTITYTSEALGRTYVVTGNEILDFKRPDSQGKRIFGWGTEIEPFSLDTTPVTVSFNSYASAGTAFAPYKEYGQWKISNISTSSCGITIAGDDASSYGIGQSYGGRTILTEMIAWGTGPQIYYYGGSDYVSFTLQRLQ